MNVFTSRTYMWVNAKGERLWVKYHFKTNQGIEFLDQEEADRTGGEDDPDMPLSEVRNRGTQFFHQ